MALLGDIANRLSEVLRVPHLFHAINTAQLIAVAIISHFTVDQTEAWGDSVAWPGSQSWQEVDV